MQTSGQMAVSSKPIRIAAAVIADTAGRVLLVRKRNTTFFMQPGGKLDDGETAVEALAREVREELGSKLVSAESLGIFSAPAANEPGHVVEAELFHTVISGDVIPGAEIEEVVWVDPLQPGNLLLAPLTGDCVLQRIASRISGKHV